MQCNVYGAPTLALKYSHGCSKAGFLTKYAYIKSTKIPFVVALLIILGIAMYS